MKIIEFLKKDIWQAKLANMPKKKAYFYRFLRTVLLTTQGFTKSQIQQGASALTYYSLLAIVPIIALLIGVARGFLLEQNLENWLTQHFSEQKEIIKQIFSYANTTLEEARGGLIAGIGVAILAWAAIKILTNVELVMNQIWEVKKGRVWAKRFTDYLAMLFLAPFMIFLASGATGYISAFLTKINQNSEIPHITTILITSLNIISFLLTSLLFTFLYIFMPNTRVKFMPALIAGIITALIYQLVQWLYFYFQIGVSSYNVIYGTFAAFPLFLIWLHLSWMIILFGAKLCFALQNVDAYEFIAQDIELSQHIRLICSIRIVHLCVKQQIQEEPALSLIELSNMLSIPLILTGQLTYHLIEANLLVEIKRKDQEEAYQPALSTERLTLKRVIDMINNKGATIPLPPSHELSLIMKNLEKFNEAIERSDGNILLKNI